MSRTLRQYLLLGASAIAGACASPAFAQSVARSDGATLQEIVVTSRRTAESLQQTPISVTAVTAEQIERANITQLDKVGRMVPNLSIQPMFGYNGGASVFIRGIGSAEPIMTQDVPVGAYLDGVYLGRTTASGNFDLVDLQRVEVLRGPQGTLFGRNTTGGAVNVVTRDPMTEPHFTQRIGYGSFNDIKLRSTFDTGEIGDSGVAAFLTVQFREHEGWWDNINAKDTHDPGAEQSWAAFLKVRGEWGPFSAAYVGDFNHNRSISTLFTLNYASPAVHAIIARSPTLGGRSWAIQPGLPDQVNLQVQPLNYVETLGHALSLQYEVNENLTVKSITSFRKYWARLPNTFTAPGMLGMIGFTPASARLGDLYLYRADPKKSKQWQWSQELQFLGSIDRLKYQGGLFYFEEIGRDLNQTNLQLAQAGGAFALPITSLQYYNVKNKSYAAYAQASYTPPILDDRVELTGGLRYTIDNKVANQFAAIARRGKKEFKNTSWLLSASFQATPDMLLFARAATGIRSGGFNVRASGPIQFEFAPEKAKSYELGLKSQWLEDRLRLNASIFYTDYTNLQVNNFTGQTAAGGGGFTSSAEANYKGGEVELTFLPTSNLQFELSVGYLDPQYDAIFFVNPATGQPQNYADQARFGVLQKWTTRLGADYTFDRTEMGELSFGADWAWSSKRWFGTINLSNVNPFNEQLSDPGHGTLNAYVMLSDIPVLDGRTRAQFRIFGENLTDEKYPVAAVDFGSAVGFAGNAWGLPRRFGVELKLDY
jgi:iron complex outermembrane receptor protein